jgi:hypothetical protein
LLNLGMYIVGPAFTIFKVRKHLINWNQTLIHGTWLTHWWRNKRNFFTK